MKVILSLHHSAIVHGADSLGFDVAEAHYFIHDFLFGVVEGRTEVEKMNDSCFIRD